MIYHREQYDIGALCPLWADYQVVHAIRKGSSVLEIGCATGYIGRYLKEKMDCTVSGIEIDKEAAVQAQPYYKELTVGDVEDEHVLGRIHEQYDYILCMNVMEHLKDPGAVLRSFRRFLKKEGLLIMALPNIGYWAIRLKLLFGNFDYGKGLGSGYGKGIMDPNHLRFFTFKSIRKLIQECGYTVQRWSIDPDMGVPKLHGLMLRIPGGWKVLKLLYSINPRLFGMQFIFILKPE